MMPRTATLPLANLVFILATLVLGLGLFIMEATAHAASKGSTLNAFPYAYRETMGNETREAAEQHLRQSERLSYPMAQEPTPEAVARSMGNSQVSTRVVLNSQPVVPFPQVKKGTKAKAPSRPSNTKPGFWYRLFHGKKAEIAKQQELQQKAEQVSLPAQAPPVAVVEAGGSHNAITPQGQVTVISTQEAAMPVPTEAPTAIAMASISAPVASSMASSISLPSVWGFQRPVPSARERALIQFIRYTNKAWDEENAHRLAYLILQSCDMHRIDYRIMSSLIATESSFRLDAVSRTGAKGLGQLKDATATWLGVRDAFDPVDNLNGTAKYLSFLADQFPNEPAKAVASYFVGQGTVKREGLSDSAIRYILKVQGHLDIVMQIERNA
jgi:hypothetical protein